MVAGQSLSQTPSLLSAYKTRTKHGRRSESHTLSPLCLQDPQEAWSPVRACHRPPLSSLPTRPARSMVAGQSRTPSLLSAYKTRTKHGRRSESHTLSPLRLQDPHEAWSPVRVAHPLSSPPTRPARSMVAGQSRTPSLLSAYKTRTKHGRRSESHTLSPLRLQDPHEALSPVRVAHPLSSPPTRPARSMVAGQSHTPPPLSACTKHGRRSEPVTEPLSPLCLQDQHETWILVRVTDAPPLSSLPIRHARSMVRLVRVTPQVLHKFR